MKKFLLLPLFALSIFACDQAPAGHSAEDEAAAQAQMELEKKMTDNLAALLDYHAKKDPAMLTSILSENYVRYMNSVQVASGRDGLHTALQPFITGFPDFTITDIRSELCGKTITIVWEFNGTNTGEFNGQPATGNKVSLQGYSRVEFDGNGMIAVEEVFYDQWALFSALGYTLAPPAAE